MHCYLPLDKEDSATTKYLLPPSLYTHTHPFNGPFSGTTGVSRYQKHTHTHPFNGPLSGTTRVGPCQKGKNYLDFLLKQETVSGSGISWVICKSAPCSRQITMPAPHHSSFFTGRMPFLLPNQQRQSTVCVRIFCGFYVYCLNVAKM